MKKLIFLLFLIPLFVKAQVETPPTLYGKQENRLTVKTAFKYPTGCGSPVGHIFPSKDSTQAAKYYDSCAHKEWNYDPALNAWFPNAGGNLQQTTDLGNKTNDTIIAEAVRTKRLLADTVDANDYEIIVIPDIQNQIHDFPAHSRAIFNWVKNNAVSRNIQAVIGLGDITNNNTVAEMDTASHQFAILDGIGMPYLAIVGNHDYGIGFNPAGRDATNYNNFFGPSRYASSPWYIGHMPGTGNENFAIKFDAGKRKFMAIGLEFLPRDTALNWASRIIDSVYAVEPDRDVIISTHAYMSWTGQLATDTTVYSTATYGMNADNDGVEMWNKLVKKKPNIKFIFNGHYIVFDYYNGVQQPSPGLGLARHNQVAGDNGNMVNQMYANYQDDTLGGRGYVMRLHFRPKTNKIDVDFYSTYLNIVDTRTTSGTYPFTIDDRSLETQNTLTATGSIVANGEVRATGFLKSEQVQNKQVVYGREDHSLRGTNDLRYFDKETHADSVGLYVKPKITTDTIRVHGFIDFSSDAYSVWRTNRNSPTSINVIADLTDTTASGAPSARFLSFNSKKFALPAIYDTRSSFTADANVPQTRSLGACETCPGSRFYTYNEIFLADNAVVSSNTIGDYQYQSRQQIRGGSSSVNRANTSNLEMGAFVSQFFSVGNVDHLGKFIAYKDQLTSFDQGNAVDQYYSFYTNHGTTKHIRSWGFYQATTLQKNFFKGGLLLGDSSLANAGSNILYTSGNVRFNSLPTGVQAKILFADASGNVYLGDTTGVYGSGGPGGGGISDGDKGDITVSGSGSVWTVDNLAITNAKINDLAWSKITSTPTTIAGYGITDFNSLGDARWSLLAHTHTFASLTSIPTTIAGYGITDAANINLSNLASVAINTSLLPATDDAIDLGSATKQWRDLYLTGSSIYMAGTKVFSSRGVRLLSNASDISSPLNGEMWYNSTSHVYKGRFNGTTRQFGTLDGTEVFTNKDLSSGNTFPTFNQNTTGSAAKWTTPRNVQGVALDGTANIDIISGTGFVKATGTTLSYDNSTYLTTSSAASTYQPLATHLTSISGLTPTNDDLLQYKAGAWTNRTIAQLKTDIGFTTVGNNIATLTNPSALGYIRANADNTVTHRSYTNVKVDLSLDNVENTALSTWAGTTNITTLGSIATGTWSATTIALNKGGTGSTTAAGARVNILPTMTGNALKVLRVNAGETDYELATASGSGTVTNTGGNLTSNSVMLGAGTVDSKVVAGITTDGTSQLNLGVNTTTLGKVKMFGNTSGDATIQPAAIAGTATVVTLPNASSTLPIFGQQLTFTGPTAARSVALPDANFTAARSDAAQTFTGVQTFSSTIVGSVNGNAATVTTNANLTGDVTSSGNATTIAAPSETAVDNNTGGWVTKKVSGSDVTTTGTTLVDITGLVSGTVSASATYEVDGMLLVTTSAVATGTEYGINCTGTGADQSINWIGPSTETGGVQVLNEVGTGNNNVAGTPAFLTTASMAGCIWFHGYVTTGTGSPTIAIRHLKVTSGTSTVKIGSTFRYRKL